MAGRGLDELTLVIVVATLWLRATPDYRGCGQTRLFAFSAGGGMSTPRASLEGPGPGGIRMVCGTVNNNLLEHKI